MPSRSTADALDRAMMEHCIALAIQAVDVGEYPYAAVICRDGEVISEGINSARQDRDVTHHAEIVVMKQALIPTLSKADSLGIPKSPAT
jgi:tRNA(adenine34) deaminase